MAQKHLEFQTKKFGLPRPNMEFKQGYIENLQELGIADNSVDVVISNCVINLSPDKRAVFAEIFRVLKPGGELYFADIFAGCRVPEHLQADSVLLGECLDISSGLGINRAGILAFDFTTKILFIRYFNVD